MTLFRKKKRFNRSSEDSGMLGKIVGLATQLQMKHEETLTPGQIEAIGAELGLEPAFIQEAIRSVQSKRAVAETGRVRINEEQRNQIIAFSMPLIVGVLALLIPRSFSAAFFFCVLLGMPLALLAGYLLKKKDLADLAFSELGIVLTLILLMNGMFGYALLYVFFALPFGRKLARKGIELGLGGQDESPSIPNKADKAGVSRQELLDQVMFLQSQLEKQKVRRVFLSVDVVDSSSMIQSSTELKVEHTFNLFRLWLETVVRNCGGEVQSSAGDGAMCLFAEDEAAVMAARHLQQDIARFNAVHNRLPLPFQIRCGVSAGMVPLEEGKPLRDLQSPALYRAAKLQKQAQPGGIVVGEEISEAALHQMEPQAGPRTEPVAAPEDAPREQSVAPPQPRQNDAQF
jgi:class 3 adenylate cyclase